ncbi:MAG: hypothetical protein M1817_006898 [Caeruleum heppii]|nr:MAG: hypothetical protein M1817_006898 [Caeruleum heppii]
MTPLRPTRRLLSLPTRALSSPIHHHPSTSRPSLTHLIVRLPTATAPQLTTTIRAASTSSEDKYDPPTGNLFNVPPGETYKKEGWEDVWVWGFWGSLIVLGVGGWVVRGDTSIQTWALEEARRRLEREGILEEPATVEAAKES